MFNIFAETAIEIVIWTAKASMSLVMKLKKESVNYTLSPPTIIPESRLLAYSYLGQVIIL